MPGLPRRLRIRQLAAPRVPRRAPRLVPLLAPLLVPLLGRAGASAQPGTLSRVTREAPATVAASLREELTHTPYDQLLWVALADVERYRCNLAASREALEPVLRRDPFHAAARAARAEALLLEGRAEEALADVDAARAAPRNARSSDLWRVRALALVELRRYGEALEAARRAVMLAPLDARAAEALGRAAYHRGDMPASRAAYTTAARLEPCAEEAQLRLGNGFGSEVEGRPWQQGEPGLRFREALGLWEAGALDRARDAFGALVRAEPEVFKYRLGLGAVLSARRRLHEAREGLPAPSLYALLPAPELPDLARVLPDYPLLGSADQQVVRVTTAPLRPWWPALVAAGATHDLLPLSENLGDRSARHDLRGRPTFDGRRYDHLRGVGGLRAATGVEKLAEASDLAFHTFAHELAHQVLAFAFPPELAARVKVLYARALAGGCCLDYYAASNVDEYFAQGYEALLSHVKRGCLKETQRHTRAELRARDPALFAFLVEQLDLSYETPASLAAFQRALPRAFPGAPSTVPGAGAALAPALPALPDR